MSSLQLTMLCLLVSLACVAFGLKVMSPGALRHGLLELPGDTVTAPPLFRNTASLTWLASAAVVEEASVRGLIQLGLTPAIPPLWAEIIAGIEFVLIHLTRFGTQGELVFVLVLSIVNGRITALSERLRYPILVHFLANVLIATVVLSLRQQ